MNKDYTKMSFEELQRLQAHHRALMAKNRQAVEDRKARTRRLIKRGAITEAVMKSYIDDVEVLTDEEFEHRLRIYFDKIQPAGRP